MKKILISITVCLGLVLVTASSNAQLHAPEKKQLNRKEDSLKTFAEDMINGQTPALRFRSDSNFVRMLVRGLLIKNSFNYPFDSLVTISKLYAPDSSFRIFSWQLKKDDYMYLQKGAIQVKTADGSLKLIPLYDRSMFTGKPNDSVRSNKNWIGAIYYKIIQKNYKGKNYYTLLGFDDYTATSNRKWMDVLTFNDNGEPQFGGPMISYEEDSVKKPIQNRFNIEYKKEARTTFNYNPELDMIIYDHLISESDEPDKKETFIPDGDFEGFKWKDGRWVHVDKVFDFKLKEGEFPVDEVLLDKDGNIDEAKLIEVSRRNKEKAEGKTPTTPPVKKKPGKQ